MTTNESVMTPGSRATWSRAAIDSYLTAASIGIFAGLAVTYLNTPLHLPGHKALFWMVPAIANRMRGTAKGAATTTVTVALATTLLLGGNMAGGAIMAPLVILAGVLLDLAIHVSETHRAKPRAAFTLLATAGMAGNFLCFIKALANPLGPLLSAANLQEMALVAGSHMIFGLLAALVGCAAGMFLRGRMRGRS